MQHIGPILNSALNNVVPLLGSSCFHTHGMLMPKEFVLAGDELVSKCGTWRWCSGSDEGKLDYLPKNKQFLVCSNIPDQYTEAMVINTDDEWSVCKPKEKELWSIVNDDFSNDDESLDDINRAMTDNDQSYIENVENIEDDDDVTVECNIVESCRYDISITYNNYYRTPQFWIIGYNIDRSVMSSYDLLNRVSNEHTNKTATIEAHPHTMIHQLSIHPCRHSSTMLSLINMMKPENGVASALFIFIKMVSTIMPNLNYDFTLNV